MFGRLAGWQTGDLQKHDIWPIFSYHQEKQETFW
jgi:hypothetical protein